MLHYAAHEAPPMTVPDPPAQDVTVPAFVPPALNAAPLPVAQTLAQQPPPRPKLGGATMLGVAAPDVTAAVAQAQAQARAAASAAQSQTLSADAPKTAPSPVALQGAQTMLGVTSPLAGLPLAPTPAAPPVQPQPGLPSTAPELPAARARTMLGVAMPGVAPLSSTGAASSSTPSTLMSPNAPANALGANATMIGGVSPAPPPMGGDRVKAPEVVIAPVGLSRANAANARPPVRSKLANTAVGEYVVPAPAPYVDDVKSPTAPPARAKGGVPMTIVAVLIGAIILLAGVAIALFYRSAPPMTAKPLLDAQGNEVLHLQCENCPDGTTAALEGAKATFKSTTAELPLTKPLNVGENNLTVTIDRPGTGRDESVKLAVPVAFRIRADLSDINAKTPVVTVRVSAAAGSDVTVDKKALALDATGNGSYVIDVSADIEGPTEDVRLIDRKIDYTIATKGGKPDVGQVSARIAIVPLRLDAPAAHAVTEGTTFTIAGQTIAGGSVTIDGTPAPTQADGSFADTRSSTDAPLALEIRASAPGRAPRLTHVTVKKVASLDAEAKAADQTTLLTYDQVAADIASKVGQRAVVAGEVLEARVAGHETIALVNDARGCKSGPCLARVIAAEDAKMARGATVRAYGEVTRAVTTSTGKTIPELQADFVARGSGSRK